MKNKEPLIDRFVDWMAEERAGNEFKKKLWDALEGTK
jgi:hypothetical protein